MDHKGAFCIKRFLSGFLLCLLLTAAAAVPAAAAQKLNTTKSEILSGGSWTGSGKHIRYLKADGTYAVNGFKSVNGKWYFFKRSGYVARGLKKLNGKYYYFIPSGAAGKIGRMKTGLVSIGEKQYFFRKKGAVGVKGSRLESAWKTVKGTKYYFRADGSLGTAYLTEEAFIKMIGKLAKEDMKRSGVLASVTIAQAILESGYGRSALALEANNLFGMRSSLSGNTWKSAWGGETYTIQTGEYIGGQRVTVTGAFRAYDSIAASVRDHSDYLTQAKNGTALRYRGIIGNKSYLKTIRIIKNGGYATSPTYVNTVVSIIKRWKLTKYDK